MQGLGYDVNIDINPPIRLLIHPVEHRSRRSVELDTRGARSYLENPSVHFGGSTTTQDGYASKFGKYGRCADVLLGKSAGCSLDGYSHRSKVASIRLCNSFYDSAFYAVSLAASPPGDGGLRFSAALTHVGKEPSQSRSDGFKDIIRESVIDACRGPSLDLQSGATRLAPEGVFLDWNAGQCKLSLPRGP